LNLDLILCKNAQKAFVVDTSCLVAPEVIKELVKLVFIELELSQAVKDVFKVLLADVASALFVNHFEQIRHRHFGSRGCFGKLVQNELLFA